jgi:hypothetical protein
LEALPGFRRSLEQFRKSLKQFGRARSSSEEFGEF